MCQGQFRELHIAPTDGSAARQFWPDMPPRLNVESVWQDPYGGWLVSSQETFNDGLAHLSLYSVDRAGKCTRVACYGTASTASASVYADSRPAFTADAAYVIAWDASDSAKTTWQIVKIPRP